MAYVQDALPTLSIEELDALIAEEDAEDSARAESDPSNRADIICYEGFASGSGAVARDADDLLS